MSPFDPQLALPLRLTPEYAAADFIPAASNAAARSWLARVSAWPEGRLVLWGASGVGKTHLLHIWTKAEHGVMLSARNLVPISPPLPGRIAIDALDDLQDERALLHLLNLAAESRSAVLLAARTPPASWPLSLPDLKSRLCATLAVVVKPPEDHLLAVLLQRLLAERQLLVSSAMQSWLLRRLPRTAAALREAVKRLDEAALASGSPVSRTLAQHALADLLNGGAAEEMDNC
ncbi:MAG: chromosomal replication initiator DnaA [Acidobacteriia bacterium]|nr:chromosomal replication initiator DnaA [Methyloceanibacter sp.]MCL6490326.1 chromosomal replication initiator DnaA [Terriglobia bacterium]